MLSVIIPSYKDKYLFPTIQSVLDNAECDVEVIPVIDGYEFNHTFDDPRVKPLILTENVGMREAINRGVAVSSGEYLMRSDEHCMFGPGFARIILETIQPNWIVVPRRYFLNPKTWTIMDECGHIDYEKMIIDEKYPKFAAVKWKSRDAARADQMVDETLAMQGSMWVMPRQWWETVIGALQTEGYGRLYQDSTEMLFKTWNAGGRLMLNKSTWYAHKHRTFNRTHNIPRAKSEESWQYALQVHRQDFERIRRQWAV